MNITREIVKSVIEIIALIFITIITYPVMNIISTSQGADVAKYYETYNQKTLTFYVEKMANLNNLIPVKDEQVTELIDYSYVNIVNNTYENKEYYFILSVDKNSTLNVEYLKLNINGKIIKLSDRYYNENDYLKYYLIDDSEIEKENIKRNRIYIYLDYETPNEAQNKELKLYFYVLDKINIINS